MHLANCSFFYRLFFTLLCVGAISQLGCSDSGHAAGNSDTDTSSESDSSDSEADTTTETSVPSDTGSDTIPSTDTDVDTGSDTGNDTVSDSESQPQDTDTGMDTDVYIDTDEDADCVVYVNGTDGSDRNGGFSWSTALKTLWAGLIIAKTENCDVWVAAGTYYPTDQDDREQTFEIPQGMGVYGGFIGDETERIQAAPYQNVTVLSGEIGDASDLTDNSHHVVKACAPSKRDGTAKLDGFIIERGYASGINSITDNQTGGGIYVKTGRLRISRCFVRDNYAVTQGGGLYVRWGTDVSTVRTMFQNNTAQDGAGVYVHGVVSDFYQCEFLENKARDNGGGAANDGGAPAFVACAFRDNEAGQYGGGIYNNYAQARLVNTLFGGNHAVHSGGGLYDNHSISLLVNDTIAQNTAGVSGGGLYEEGSESIIANSVVWNNTVSSVADEIVINGGAPVITHSVVQNGCAAIENAVCGARNQSGDPLFEDAASGLFQLKSGSSGLDNGDIYFYTALDSNDADGDGISHEHFPYDLDGNTRVSGGGIDIGAFESVGALPAVSACPVYVTRDGDDANDGTSWPNAVSSIERALTLAAGSVVVNDASQVCEIWVAAGTYVPHDPGGRTSSFRLHPDVSLYGGFSGHEDSLNERDYESHITVLSGDRGVQDDTSDNAYHVVTGATGARLDGFVLTQGNADHYGSWFGGAAMVNTGADPTVVNCTFEQNRSITGITGGGAMFNIDASPRIHNCVFHSNEATVGGAMLNGQFSNPYVTRTIFDNNTAHSGGGAVRNVDGGSPHFSNCSFRSNTTAAGGGGAVVNYASDVRIDQCTFSSNTAANGAAVFSGAGAPTIIDSVFENNTAAEVGGALYHSNAYATIVGNTFRGNSAYMGGAYYDIDSYALLYNNLFVDNEAAALHGGALYLVQSSAQTTVVNSVFKGNTAVTLGGAIYSNNNLRLINNTLVGNEAAQGGAVYATGSLEILNSILWGNEATTAHPHVYDNNANSFISATLVEGGCDQIGAATCVDTISDDPAFVDDTVDIPALSDTSPCVDAASLYYYTAWDAPDIDDDGIFAEHFPVDISNGARLQGARIDMGAQERSGNTPSTGSCPVHVALGGADTADGVSWDTPMATVDAALAAAATRAMRRGDAEGCAVWVAAGSYYPAEALGRYAALRLHPSVSLYGGFAGDETSIDARDLTAHQTVLSGQRGDLMTNEDNVYHVVLGAHSATLDGVVVSDGYADGGDINGGGAGLLLDGRLDMTVAHCTFENNQGNNVYTGGAMYIAGRSNPSVESTVFVNNAGYKGGAVVVLEKAGPRFDNCTFWDNAADNAGSDIFSELSPYVVVKNSIFWWQTDPDTYLLASSNGAMTVLYSDAKEYVPGLNNSMVDPLFVSDSFRLTAGSPCVDAGHEVNGDAQVDRDGRSRVVGVGVDLGAYERRL